MKLPAHPLTAGRTPSHSSVSLSPERPDVRLPVLLGVLAIAFVPLVYGAIRAFPIWDDGDLMLMLNEHGAEAFRLSMRERPFSGYLMWLLIQTGSIKVASMFFHVPLWILTGWITASVWSIFFPRYRQYGLFAGLLAMSPIVAETQLIVIVVPTIHQLSTVSVFSAFLLCHYSRTRSALVFGAALALAAALVFFGVIVSEYGVAALMTTGVLFLSIECIYPGVYPRKRTRIIIAAMIAVGIAGYITYHATAEAAARQTVRPEFQLRAQGPKRLLEMPLRLPAALWNATVGELFKKAGEVDLRAGNGPALVFGAFMVLLVFLVIRRLDHSVAPAGPAGPDSSPTPRARGVRRLMLAIRGILGRPVPALIVAALLPLIPIMVMKVSPRPGCLSRLWTPVVPAVSVLTIYLLVTAFSGRRRRIALLLLTFVLGFKNMNAALASVRTKDRIVEDGKAVRPLLAPAGLTAVIYTNYTGFTLGNDAIPDAAELTARMTEGWAPEERQRVWVSVYSYVDGPKGLPTIAEYGVCSKKHVELTYIGMPQDEMDSSARRGFVQRVGPIAKILWLATTADGTLRITPQAVTGTDAGQ